MTSTAPVPAPVPVEAPPHMESHGIDLIPDAERHGSPRDLFAMWLGGNLNVFYVVNGAVVISMGLSFAQSLLAIVVGNLAFLAVGFASLQGPRTGTSTFAVSRASYGPSGGRFLALFNWVTCIGFEASGLALIALAALAVFAHAGLGASTALKIAVIVVASAIQAVLPLLGHRAILLAQRRLAWLFTVLFVVMAILVGPKVHLGHLSHGSGWAPVTWAIALVISGGGLSWANTASDYSRYLARSTSARQVFWCSSVGGFLPAVLLETLGAAVASATTSASDPIAGIPAVLPGWVSVPYLLFAIVTLLAVNTLDLYSSGLTLQAAGLRLARWQCVLVDTVICTALCFLVIFSGQFNRYYSDFLGLLIIWMAPWFAIYATDALLRRQRYDAAGLLDSSPRGRYWRHGGFFLPGVVAQLLGMTASALWISSAAFAGPLSTAVGGSDFSVFTGLGVGGLVYWLLARREVSRETAELVTATAPASLESMP
jgi:NCS1 family nucleobase:cation symporter-1